MISVIIPVHNGSATLRRCLEAVMASNYLNFECIVVDDGSTDDSSAIAKRFPLSVLRLLEGPFGPAYARNRGAEAARGSILFFVDSDVVIRPDTLLKAGVTLSANQEVHAVFGSYDNDPEHKDFLSQYKNLFHHYVHQQGEEAASTFWAGCGAVRREAFFDVGGYDEEKYPSPSIEDIELGYRLRTAGHKILLDKSIQAKHLKRWTLMKLIKSEIIDRGIPWTLLILQNRKIPNDLNLQLPQRLSALLMCVLLLLLGLSTVLYKIFILPLLAGLYWVIVGCWNGDEGPLFNMKSTSVISIMLSLVGGTIGFAVYSTNPWVILSFTPVLILTLAWFFFPTIRLIRNQLYFISLLLSFIIAFMILLMKLPILLTILVGLLLFTILMLNRHFYGFFMNNRGLPFAVAVIPFHLLYYLYSVLSFALGFLIYFWDRVKEQRMNMRRTLRSDTP